jgi:hypothetical protein
MSTRRGFYVTGNNKSKNDPIKFKDGTPADQKDQNGKVKFDITLESGNMGVSNNIQITIFI